MYAWFKEVSVLCNAVVVDEAESHVQHSAWNVEVEKWVSPVSVESRLYELKKEWEKSSSVGPQGKGSGLAQQESAELRDHYACIGCFAERKHSH